MSGPPELLSLWREHLSRGGLFVATGEMRALYHRLDVTLATPGGSLTLGATVVHASDPARARELGVPPGLGLQRCRLIDGQGAATLHLDGVALPAPLLAAPLADLQARLQTALDRATLAHGAELLGAMGQAFDTLQAYLQTRQQFGRAIASTRPSSSRVVSSRWMVQPSG